MAVCQIIYDAMFYPTNVTNGEPAVDICGSIDIFGGVTVTLWTSILSFVILYVVKYKRRINMLSNMVTFSLIVYLPSVTLLILSLIYSFTSDDSINYDVDTAYSNLRTASIGVNVLAFLIIFVFVQRTIIFHPLYMSNNPSQSSFSQSLHSSRSLTTNTSKDSTNNTTNTITKQSSTTTHIASTMETSLVILSKRMMYYPLMQLITRLPAAVFEQLYGFSSLETSSSTNIFILKCFFVVLQSSAGIGFLMIFLIFQPKAWQHFHYLLTQRRFLPTRRNQPTHHAHQNSTFSQFLRSQSTAEELLQQQQQQNERTNRHTNATIISSATGDRGGNGDGTAGPLSTSGRVSSFFSMAAVALHSNTIGRMTTSFSAASSAASSSARNTGDVYDGDSGIDLTLRSTTTGQSARTTRTTANDRSSQPMQEEGDRGSMDKEDEEDEEENEDAERTIQHGSHSSNNSRRKQQQTYSTSASPASSRAISAADLEELNEDELLSLIAQATMTTTNMAAAAAAMNNDGDRSSNTSSLSQRLQRDVSRQQQQQQTQKQDVENPMILSSPSTTVATAAVLPSISSDSAL